MIPGPFPYPSFGWWRAFTYQRPVVVLRNGDEAVLLGVQEWKRTAKVKYRNRHVFVSIDDVRGGYPLGVYTDLEPWPDLPKPDWYDEGRISHENVVTLGPSSQLVSSVPPSSPPPSSPPERDRPLPPPPPGMRERATPPRSVAS